MKISICIPCYEYKGKGVECLDYSLMQLYKQKFKDFEVVISDHSVDNGIQKLCSSWLKNLNINYIRNEKNRGNPAFNTNVGMLSAKGEWIKILNQDDFLLYENSLDIINYCTECGRDWLATAYLHTTDRKSYYRYHAPMVNSHLCVVNTIGSPSCVAFRNIKPLLLMDANLKYAYDCEYYYRFMQAHGLPYLCEEITMGNLVWENSITSDTTIESINKENNYILDKHGLKNEKIII